MLQEFFLVQVVLYQQASYYQLHWLPVDKRIHFISLSFEPFKWIVTNPIKQTADFNIPIDIKQIQYGLDDIVLILSRSYLNGKKITSEKRILFSTTSVTKGPVLFLLYLDQSPEEHK